MIIVYHSHSCIRDQCWKSFPSPISATAHVSQGGCGTQGPVGFGQQGPAPSCFVSVRHPTTVSASPGRLGPSRKRRRSYGGQPAAFVGKLCLVRLVTHTPPNFWVCSFTLRLSKNVFPAIRKYLVKYHLCIDNH